MHVIYSPDHSLHESPGEIASGELVPAFERSERVEIILNRAREVNLGAIRLPDQFPSEALLRIHDPRMVDLLMRAGEEWEALKRKGVAIPITFPARGMRHDRLPVGLDGKLAFFCFDAASPLTPTSWQAIRSSSDVALTGARMITSGANSAFSLCRPPGHHAGTDHYGGYCFLNNAAIAAQFLIDSGAGRVAVLDVDYHHGNGTQQIFYGRSDVLVVNIHATPDQEYPYLLGFEDETGIGAGEGYNLNLPLPWGSGWKAWGEALENACKCVAGYAPDVLIVSLGVDTYVNDPISRFALEHEHFSRMGSRIGRLGLPALFVMEGGYAVDEIGLNTVNVLTGYEGR